MGLYMHRAEREAGGDEGEGIVHARERAKRRNAERTRRVEGARSVGGGVWVG